MYNNGNVPYELLIRKNTVITNLEKYHPKLEHVTPQHVTLSEILNTSQCISKFCVVIYIYIYIYIY